MTGPHRRLVGSAAAAQVLAALARTERPLVVVDAGARPVLPPAVDAVLQDSARVPTVALHGSSAPVALLELERLSERVRAASLVLAVGSGRTLDAAKIASSGAAYLRESLSAAAGARFVAPVRAGTPLIAVPTTVGTGAETSAKALLSTDTGRLLLLGECLRPGTCWIVPDALATLPARTLALGGLEIVCRLLGPWTGLGRSAPARCAALAAAVVQAVDGLLAGGRQATPARATLFSVTALAHDPALAPPDQPFAFWLWPLVNEVATLLGAAKTDVLVALLPCWLAAPGPAAPRAQRHLLARLPARWGLPAGRPPAPDVRSAALDRLDAVWRPLFPGLPRREVLDEALGASRDRPLPTVPDVLERLP